MTVAVEAISTPAATASVRLGSKRVRTASPGVDEGGVQRCVHILCGAGFRWQRLPGGMGRWNG